MNRDNKTNRLAYMCARKQVDACNTPRKPSAQDVVDNRNAVRMCVLIAMLNSTMWDLRFTLDDAGMFKHKIKRDVVRVHDAICTAHNQLSKIVGPSSSKASKQYNSLMDVCVEDVNNAILIEDAIEKQYNICLSLCRLVGTYNAKLKSRYRFIPADEFVKFEAILKGANIAIDDNIDFIVDSNITIKYSDAN